MKLPSILLNPHAVLPVMEFVIATARDIQLIDYNLQDMKMKNTIRDNIKTTFVHGSTMVFTSNLNQNFKANLIQIR